MIDGSGDALFRTERISRCRDVASFNPSITIDKIAHPLDKPRLWPRLGFQTSPRYQVQLSARPVLRQQVSSEPNNACGLLLVLT